MISTAIETNTAVGAENSRDGSAAKWVEEDRRELGAVMGNGWRWGTARASRDKRVAVCAIHV
ncbi:MAG: hypothetical protein ABI120_04720, partial [Gemmatimonadaceae bacterium]